MSDHGDVGFETLVRALARNEQEDLAKELDEELAEQFMPKPSGVAGTMSLPSFCLVCWSTGRGA